MKSLSEGGVGFRPDLSRPMGRYRRFAAPSPHPSPRRGEGDDVSRAPSFQDRPGRFSPSPRRGEGARRAGEGAGPKARQKRGLSPASTHPSTPRFHPSLALGWCKVGVDGVEESTAKGAFLLRTSGRWRLPFPPL